MCHCCVTCYTSHKHKRCRSARGGSRLAAPLCCSLPAYVPVVGNPWNTGAVFQALPTVQGMGSANGADLNHGHAVGAENLSLASLRPVNGRINGHVMGDMGWRAVGGRNHVSHVITFAVGVGGTLVDSVEEHVVASSLMVGGQLYLNQLCLGRIIASALTLAVWLEYGLLYNREVALPDIFKC